MVMRKCRGRTITTVEKLLWGLVVHPVLLLGRRIAWTAVSILILLLKLLSVAGPDTAAGVRARCLIAGLRGNVAVVLVLFGIRGRCRSGLRWLICRLCSV